MLSLVLSKDGFHVWTASTGKEGLDVLRSSGERFDICLTDVRMPGMDGLAFIEDAIRLGDRSPTFIVMSAYGDEKMAIEALRRGAFDYISKPFQPEELALKLRLVVEKKSLARSHSGRESPAIGSAPASRRPSRISDIITNSESMRAILRTVQKVASFPTTVLITGETGTGKERIAGAIHMDGKRKDKAFVAVNCGAIPENLLESELFGHVKGAFTDANVDKTGLFETASGGTLFLDEIAELPLSLQVKILRALVEKEIRRVGDTRTIPVDVRLIAATSRDLRALMASGAFREDLFYRLNVVSIHLPPLRERSEDIPHLVRHFVDHIGSKLGLSSIVIDDEAMGMLERYSWPGNVRELENAIERAIVLSEGGTKIAPEDLDERFEEQPLAEAGTTPIAGSGRIEDVVGEDLSFKVVIPQIERLLIRRALEHTGGNRTRAASLLGISHRALLYKLKEYGIS